MITHHGPISGVAVNQERWIATAGYDNQVLLWNPDLKQAVARGIHDHLVNHVTFSPDGQLLVSSSSDHSARIWSVPDLKLLSVLGPHNDDVESSAFSPNGSKIATACRDGQIRIFDKRGTLIKTFTGHSADALSVCWQSEKSLISSGDDGTIRKWCLSATDNQSELLADQNIETDTLAITDQGAIYSGDDSGSIRLIYKKTNQITHAHRAGIKRLCYHSKNRLLVSVSYDRTLKLWAVGSNYQLSVLCTAQLPAIVWPRSCAFFGDNELIFGTFGGSYATFNIAAKKWSTTSIPITPSKNSVTLHKNSIYSIGDSGDLHCDGKSVKELGSLCNFLVSTGTNIITGGQIGTVFDAIRGIILYQHRSPLNCGAVFKQEGQTKIIIGSYTGEALVFKEDEDGQIVFEQQIAIHHNAIKGIACSKDRIFSVDSNGSTAIHTINNFNLIQHLHKSHHKIANGCAHVETDSASCFVSVSRDLKLRVWNGNSVTVVDSPHQRSIKCVASNSLEGLIATGSYSGEIGIYDLKLGNWHSMHRPTTSGISSIVSTPTEFVASSYDGKLYTISVSSLNRNKTQ
jgi:WD40 repeat protein